MTRAEIRVEVRVGIAREAEQFSDASINTRINWAKDKISGLRDWHEMRLANSYNCIINQRNYLFPSTLKKLYNIRLIDGTNSRVLDPRFKRTFDKGLPYPENFTSGRPYEYIIQGRSFDLNYIPDDTYEYIIFGLWYPADFSAETDSFTLLKKDDLIVAITTWYCLTALKEYENANNIFANVVTPLLQTAIEADYRDNDQTFIAQEFGRDGYSVEEYWNDALVKGQL